MARHEDVRVGVRGDLNFGYRCGGHVLRGFLWADNDRKFTWIFDASLATGVSLIDTSNSYGMGRSEEAIESYLVARGAGTHDRFLICTKAGITNDPATGERFYDNSAAHLEADHVDLFYVHRREATRPSRT